MKANTFLLTGLLLLGYSSQAKAQDGTAADVEAVRLLVGSHPDDLDKQMKPFYKKNKKNAEHLAAFARIFCDDGDTIHANTYANHALEVSKYKSAPAYVVLGDLETMADRKENAASLYDQALLVDSMYEPAYFKFADLFRKSDVAKAIAKLEELRSRQPQAAIDAYAARIYYDAKTYDKALESYDKADLTKLDSSDLRNFAMSAFVRGQAEKSLGVAKYGLSTQPRSALLNRLAFYNSVKLKKYDEGLGYGDALFNKSDSATFNYTDYACYGNAFFGTKQYDKAVEQYLKALEQDNLSNKAERTGIVKQLSDSYEKKSDFANAIKYYKEFLDNTEHPSANDLEDYAALYVKHGSTLEGEAQTEAFKKAIEAYANLAAQHESAIEYATFMQARLNRKLDPDQTQGLAKPFYEKMAILVGSKGDLDAVDKTRMTESLLYLISYYLFHENDKESAVGYANQLLDIDPDNEIAKEVLESGQEEQQQQ